MTKSKKIILASVLSVLTLGGFAAYAGDGDNYGFGMHNFTKRGFGMHDPAKRGFGMHNFTKRGFGMYDPAKRDEFMLKRMTYKLDLNDAQVANLKAVQQLFANYRKEKKAQKDSKLLALLDAPTLDQAQALHILQTRAEERKVEAPEIIAAIATFTDSLSNEQRAKLKEILQRSPRHGGFGNITNGRFSQ
jgi:Spy/CpxP family protein refolding chaperone